MMTFSTILVLLCLESGNQGEAGMRAVASVVYNRAKGNYDDMQRVMLYPKAFDCFNDGVQVAEMRYYDFKAHNGMAAALVAYRIAKEMQVGSFRPISTATHYCRVGSNPFWKSKLEYVCTQGDHEFYREDRKF